MGLVVPSCQAYEVKFQFYFNCDYQMGNTTHYTSDFFLYIQLCMWSMGTTIGPKLMFTVKFILAQECGLFKGKHQNVCLRQLHFVKQFICGMGALLHIY